VVFAEFYDEVKKGQKVGAIGLEPTDLTEIDFQPYKATFFTFFKALFAPFVVEYKY